jgi:hypothetical protein
LLWTAWFSLPSVPTIHNRSDMLPWNRKSDFREHIPNETDSWLFFCDWVKHLHWSETHRLSR